MNRIWVISDIAETAYELLGKARELVGEGNTTAYVIGDESVGKTAISYGADDVMLMEMPQNLQWEQYVAMLIKEAQDVKPELILVSATRRGKDLAAQIAALLDAPCVSECKNIEVDGEKLKLQRIVYGGLADKIMECSAFPVVATIAAKTFNKFENPDTGRTGNISKLEITGEANAQVLERRSKPKETVDITEAEIVVGIGRGLSEKEDMKLAENLAEVLGGEVACTRPIAEDLGWLPEDRYIGISGQVVKPNLYLCAGVSGQVQHVYGIRDSKVIVAIDKNENAPIFDVADYFIVGDLKEVLPAITEAVKEVKGS